MTVARLARILRQRLRSLGASSAQDAELDHELQFHLEALTREKIDEGLSAADARRAARLAFGNVVTVRDASRDARRVAWLRDAGQDLVHGWRRLRREPGLALTAIASLAIGIGAMTAVLGVIKVAFLDPLPFAAQDRLVVVRSTSPDASTPLRGATLLEYATWRDRLQTVDLLGASMSGPHEIAGDPLGEPGERVPGQFFTPSVFQLLGVSPVRGHVFEDANGAFDPAARVVIISHRLWQRRFAGAEDVLGRTLVVDRAPRAIVGVMPQDFRFQDANVDLWMPYVPGPNAITNPGSGRVFIVTARLRVTATVSDLQRELDAIAADLSARFPDRFAGWRVRVMPLREAMYSWTATPLRTMLAAVTLMLVVAAANLAALLLARVATRVPELRVRLSLGATRARIARQLFTEGLWLALAGGALAIVVARVGLHTLSEALGPPPGTPRIGSVSLDSTLVMIGIAVTAFTALGFGLPAAFAGSQADASGTDAGDQRPAAVSHRQTGRLRRVLVAAEVALATVLVIASALLFHSYTRLLSRDLNFDPSGLLSFEYVVPVADYAQTTGIEAGVSSFAIAPTATDAIARVYDRLRDIPGVAAVAGVSYPPVNSLIVPRFLATPIATPGDSPDRAQGRTIAYFQVTPGFFAAMRTPLLSGRDVTDADDRQGAPIVVVNEAAAVLLWPGRRVIGRHLALSFDPSGLSREVVGVVANVPVLRRALTPEPIVYGPFLQAPASFRGPTVGLIGNMTFMLRHSGTAASMWPVVRRAAAEVDPARPIVNAGVVEAHLNARLIEQRNYVAAVGSTSVAAMLLAALGVYGVTAFAVTAHTREVAIRRALGARRREIVLAVCGRVVSLAMLGIVSGVALAAWLTRLIASQLWGIAPTDLATYGAAAVLLLAVVLLAALGPAVRALSVDPARVLRSE